MQYLLLPVVDASLHNRPCDKQALTAMREATGLDNIEPMAWAARNLGCQGPQNLSSGPLPR